MLSKVPPQKGKPINLLKSKKKLQITIWHKLLFLSPVFVIILIIKGNEWYSEYQLLNNGIETVAAITIVSSIGVRDPVEINNVEFEFSYNDSIVKGYSLAQINNNFAFSENGMPLFVGDEFTLKYVKDNPEIYELNYNKPTYKTIEKYIFITSETLAAIGIYPKSQSQIKQCNCLSKKIYNKYNLDGLATIIFHDELIVENIMHNSFAFKKFINKKEVKELIKMCEN